MTEIERSKLKHGDCVVTTRMVNGSNVTTKGTLIINDTENESTYFSSISMKDNGQVLVTRTRKLYTYIESNDRIEVGDTVLGFNATQNSCALKVKKITPTRFYVHPNRNNIKFISNKNSVLLAQGKLHKLLILQ